MIQVAPGTRVYLACRPVDMRRGFDGLAAEVANVLRQDPYSSHVFILRSKRGDDLKMLHWDGSGLCLFVKRLEKGRFAPPRACCARSFQDRIDRLLAIDGHPSSTVCSC